MSTTTEILMQTLLSQKGLQQGSGNASIADMLGQLAQGDQRMAPLVRLLQERAAASAVAADSVPENDDSAEDPSKSPETAGGGEELKSLTENMFAEVESLRARNDMLATALGACHLCWGEDRKCPYCHGAGRVGAYVINLDLFEQVIGPAVRQVRRRPRLVNPQPIGKGDDHGNG